MEKRREKQELYKQGRNMDSEGWREVETEKAMARESPKMGTEGLSDTYVAHTRVLDIHPHRICYHFPLAIFANQCVIGHQAEGRNKVGRDGQRQHYQVLAGLPLLASHLQQLPLVHDLGGQVGMRTGKAGGRRGASGMLEK